MHLTESIDMKDGRASHNLTFLKDLSKPTCAQHKKEEVRRSFLDQMLVTHFWYLTLIFNEWRLASAEALVCVQRGKLLYSFAISFFKISTVYLFNFRYHVSEIFFIRNQCIQELFSATFSCVVLRTRGEPGSNCMFGYHIVTLVTAVTFNFMCCKHSNLVLHERNLRNPGIFLTDR